MPASINLSTLTTLGLGGPAPSLTVAATDDEICAAVAEADFAGAPLLVVGGGSNLVIADEGIAGPVVQVANTGVSAVRDGDDLLVTAAAGVNWDELVAQFCGEGWSGIEFLSGIPGSTGATPVQNVGAYGMEVSEVLENVTVFDRATRGVQLLHTDQLQLGYRSSVLRGSDRAVVLRIQMRLSRRETPVKYAELAKSLGVAPGESVPPAVVRECVLGLRRSKGMVLDPGDPDSRSAGSFFTNPLLSAEQAREADGRIRGALGSDVSYPHFPAGDRVKLSAAWLIERAGFGKGFHLGAGAGVSTKHTLALVNRGGTTRDLVNLARYIRDGVVAKFGVTLIPEPVFVGVTLD
ncbi:UDP-N-acetylmuramate dehydrogenase [Nakamurella antarctica]|uniref:UDP-N-acetylenolpyruvoylglucosamine reductase n=1 Tax=Nakamurella antarctica TaxID=1902245 RepID=A0A3G8ZYB8_9ACTN|nr:UDP-N-acetylmuramate dehydrogenase [Nakamurella antarctica]AZI59026.1 UDP-N-acetylmuramate dehydrogenase [Nakamurella antarctica]